MKRQKCPRCEKKVLDVRRYKNGDRFYVHASKVMPPFGFTEIDGCYVKRKTVTHPLAG